MHGRLHHVILDCPDPRELARFYSELLNHPITYASDEFVVVAANDTTSGLAFQLAPDHRAPTWPDTTVPQQMHLDIMVENVAHATPHVLYLGATKLDGEGVFADPAGHPFCLVRLPAGLSPSRIDRLAHRLITHPSRQKRTLYWRRTGDSVAGPCSGGCVTMR